MTPCAPRRTARLWAPTAMAFVPLLVVTSLPTCATLPYRDSVRAGAAEVQSARPTPLFEWARVEAVRGGTPLLGGPMALAVGAQPHNRVELQLGGGISWTQSCNVCSLASYEVGVTSWGRNHWGVSARHEFRPRYSVDDSLSDGSVERSSLNIRISTLTVRRRWFRNNGTELDFGFGMGWASLNGANAWVVPIDVFLGRKLSRHIGVKGGVSLGYLIAGRIATRPKAVGFAVIGF